MPREVPLPGWPNGADVAVSLTFDVDAEAGWLGDGAREYTRRLTSVSEGRFGVVRGLARIVDLLESFSIPGTFYVPGETVERHSEAINRLVEAGHEIGHHGHRHLRSDQVSELRQREEIELGLAALESVLSIQPEGYRSPSWELTPETFELLLEFGFAYDSSCMGDDRPYLEELNGQSILELPVHWSLDDWPYFGWTIDTGGNLADARDLERNWLDEFACARLERRHITYTMHPEVIGRGYTIVMLQRFLDVITSERSVWFATHAQIAATVAKSGTPSD